MKRIKAYHGDESSPYAWMEDRDGRIFLGSIWCEEAIEVHTAIAADKISDLLFGVYAAAREAA